MTISQAAEKYVELNNPGSYIGPYLNSEAFYMQEPMDELASHDYDAVVFVGPAQAGKTQSLLLNWLAYSVVVDPMDMILYNPTKGAARDFSVRRVDRMHRDSPKVGDKLLKKRDSDNKFDKMYRGMMLTLSHPSQTEFAGRPIPRVALTDYDRMPENVDGDGSPFDLASKRTTSFGSFAMTLAESSPSRPLTNTKWIPATPHEAPPTTGILALYNRGDRRQRYWPCPECGKHFVAKFADLTWNRNLPNRVDAAETVRLLCPHNGCTIHPDSRNEMDMFGSWLREGQYFDEQGRIAGDGRRTDIVSFWMFGPCANFTTWKKLVLKYLAAEEEFESTGSEEALKKFFNTDCSEPYIPKSADSERLPEILKSRAEVAPTRPVEMMERGIERMVTKGIEPFEPLVPEDVRFLMGLIDVQKNMFVVQVFGVLPGQPFDMVLIDRFNIKHSDRLNDDGERLFVKPHAEAGDWDLIKTLVMERTYELADGTGRRMMIKMTGCDSGGREGVTSNAYAFYRKLKMDGLHARFHLIKGNSTPGAPRTAIATPDSNRRDKLSIARGDVPVLMLNSNEIKDILANRMESVTPGHGMFRLPNWVPDFVYTELCVEVREPKGWMNPLERRNEAWDLSYYAIGLAISPLLRVEKIDWDNCELWCAPWEKNALIFSLDESKPFAAVEKKKYDWAATAEAMA